MYLVSLCCASGEMANVSTSHRPTCKGKLTGGSAEEAAFCGLPKATRLRVGVTAVSLLPPFEFGPRPGFKFPRFDHFRGLKYSRYPDKYAVQLQMTLSLRG